MHGDIARCPGSGDEEEGWREGCDVCQRRAEPGTCGGWWIEPPPIIAFECEFLIEKKAPIR